MINKNTTLPFIDVLFVLLLVFVVIITLLKTKAEDDPAFKQSAAYLVVLNWEGPADLDLWVKDPSGRKAGFARREAGQGSLMSLNRDCLGSTTTEVDREGNVVNPINEEIVTLRGTQPGEYIVNVHSYNMRGPEATEATVKLYKILPHKQVIVNEHTFTFTGDEFTFFRFTLDQEGLVTATSDLPIKFLGEAAQPNF